MLKFIEMHINLAIVNREGGNLHEFALVVLKECKLKVSGCVIEQRMSILKNKWVILSSSLDQGYHCFFLS